MRDVADRQFGRDQKPGRHRAATRRGARFTVGLLSLLQWEIDLTVIAALLTLVGFTVLALVFFGGDVLKSFSWALFIGVVISTYSTIYIASPVMLWWEGFKARPRSAISSAPNAAVTLSGAASLGVEASIAGASQKRKRKKRRYR